MEVFQASLLAAGGLLQTFRVPWLVDTSPSSLPSCSHGIVPVCVCLCVHISPLHKDTSHIGLRPKLMTLITPVKTLFPNQVTFCGIRTRTSTYLFWGEHNSTPNSYMDNFYTIFILVTFL